MPSKRDLGSLVSGAGDDITPPAPLRRGGGLSSLIGSSGEPPAVEPETRPPATATPRRPAAPPDSPPAGVTTTPQADLTTNAQADMSTSQQAETQAAPRTRPAPPAATRERKVSSYRIDTELARRVKIYAAMYDLNDYEVVERALTEYLDRHARGPEVG